MGCSDVNLPDHTFLIRSAIVPVSDRRCGGELLSNEETRGAVATRHCTPALMKQVLPRFRKPHTPASPF